MTKKLQEGSLYEYLDADGDGVITDAEMSRAKEIAEWDHNVKKMEKKEDQIRQMAWFALFGLLLYPIGIVLSSYLGLDTASQLISDIAPTYFVAISALVAAFFGAQAYTKGK